MYKLIALDLDGTLTDKNKNILEETKQELIKLAQKGVIIVLASGRPTAGIFKEAKELILDQVGGYLLSFNGARVLDYKTNEVVYEQTLSSEIAHEMYDRAKAFGLSPLTYNATEIITEDIGDHWIQLESFTTKMNIKHVQDFKKEVNFDVNKVLITGEPAYVAQILDEFKAPYEGKMSIYRSDPYFIECMANGIDKAASLDVLCKKLGIKQEETVAFGDGYNDLSLIEYCGYGVAMENAVDEVKERANYITLSNNDNGIAYCLKQLEEKGLIFKMIKKQIAFHSTEIEEMYTLYQQAFPKNEQMDLTRLFDELHLGAIYGYYQENQLVGFAILCIQSQIAHILYLAVKKEYRDQGIGSYILNDLAKQYDSKKIIVDIEKIKDTSNKEQRIKRKQFYLKNDFKETDVFYTWQGEDYVILSRNGIVQKKEFWNFWDSLKKEKK